MDIVVSTAAKWAYTKVDEPWRHAIVDEAYQMRSDALLSVAGLFERALFVGDPGQLDPFSVVGAEQWAGLAYDPSSSAVSTLLAHNPDLPQHRLPVSWRLPASAAPLVSAAFYPYTPFRSGTGHGDRFYWRSGCRATARAWTGSWTRPPSPAGACWNSPPAIHRVRTRRRSARWPRSCAGFLDRGGATTSEAHGTAAGAAPAPAPLTAARIAVGTAHRDQAAAVRAALAALGVTGVAVDTANRLQGREFDVTVVLHPLSGRPDATAFHLETGRLCVLASRHRHACIVVCRAGVADLLDEHPSTDPVRLGVTVKFPDGWEANHAVLAHLAEHRVTWRP